MAYSTAHVRTSEKVINDLIISRAQEWGLNVDAHKIDVARARPYEITIHGEHGDDVNLPDLWEDVGDVQVVSLVEGDL